MTWGEERIANGPKVKLGIRVSPRTVGEYLKRRGRPNLRNKDQRWASFVRNQAKVIAGDFFASVSLTFRFLYVFVAMEIGSRRIPHCDVTAHPTAEWTTQQFREVFNDVHPYQFVIHDHDSIFSASLDAALSDLGVRILRTPVQAPTANAYCERLVGTIRRECLDYLIPVNERHLHLTLKEFAAYYNRARPHSAVGPGTPEPILAGVAPALGISFRLVAASDRCRCLADYIAIIGCNGRLCKHTLYFLMITVPGLALPNSRKSRSRDIIGEHRRKAATARPRTNRKWRSRPFDCQQTLNGNNP
jgi:hypothetical protein